MDIEKEKKYCDMHSGNVACMLSVKKDIAELKDDIKHLEAADELHYSKLDAKVAQKAEGEMLREVAGRIENCQACSTAWKDTYRDRVDFQLSSKVGNMTFKMVVSGIGAIGIGLLWALFAQTQAISEINRKVDVGLIQTEMVQEKLISMNDRLTRIEQNARK